MKKKVWIGTILLFCALCFQAIGCTKGTSKEIENEPKDKSYTYKEQMLELPQNVNEITDISIINKQTIRLAGRDESKTCGTIWESADNGDTWGKIWDSSNAIQEEAKHIGIRLSSDKKAVISYYNNAEEHVVLFLDENDSLVETSQKFTESVANNKLQAFELLNQDRVLASSETQSYIIETESGKTTALPDFFSYEIVNSELYLMTIEGIKRVGINTGNEIALQESAQSAHKYLMDMNLKTYKLSIMVQGSLFIKEEDKQKVYLADADHILKFDENETGLLLDKGKTILGDQRFYIQEFFSLTESDDVLLVSGFLDSDAKLIRYDRSNQKQEVQNELSIYALKEDLSLKQMINMYQMEYPETNISLEIGIKDDEITVDEAIKVLNTRLAGNDGPDILLLDGLNVNNYAGKGLLENLGDIVEMASAEGDVLTNIIKSYSIEDGYYGIPLHFAVMNFTAPKDLANKTDTIENLTDTLVNLSKDADKPVFENWVFDQLVSILYRTYAIKENEAISESELSTFYQCIKKLYGLVDMSEVKNYKKLKNLSAKTREWNCADVVITGETQTAMDCIMTPEGIRDFALAETALPNQNYLFKTSEDIYYNPLTTLGIVATSKEKDEAKKFISFALSNEAQSSYRSEGLAVNIDTLQEQMKDFTASVVTVKTESGGKQTVKFPGLNGEQIGEWIKRFQSLNHAVIIDDIIFQIIMEHMDEIVQGSVSPEEGAQRASRKIKLYLAE